jgi:rod shape-determining protein MreD
MKKFYLFLFILAVFFLQFSVLGAFFKSGRIPNLFVALTVSLAIIFGFEKSLGWVVFAGFLLDAGSSWLIGSGILALVIILWLIDKMKAIAEFRSKRYLFAVLLFLTAGVSSVVFDILMKLVFGAERFFFLNISAPHYFTAFGADYILKTFWTALSIIPVYFFARKIPERPGILLAKNKR